MLGESKHHNFENSVSDRDYVTPPPPIAFPNAGPASPFVFR